MPAASSPTGSNSFIFAYFFAKKCLHQRSVPTPPIAQHPPQWEILDPPLWKLLQHNVIEDKCCERVLITLSVADPGFPIGGGADPFGGGTDL